MMQMLPSVPSVCPSQYSPLHILNTSNVQVQIIYFGYSETPDHKIHDQGQIGQQTFGILLQVNSLFGGAGFTVVVVTIL